jgi:hypothetical protein
VADLNSIWKENTGGCDTEDFYFACKPNEFSLKELETLSITIQIQNSIDNAKDENDVQNLKNKCAKVVISLMS